MFNVATDVKNAFRSFSNTDELKTFFNQAKSSGFGNMGDISTYFESELANSPNNFGLDDKGIAHVRKYFDYLKKEGKTINQLSLEKFTTEIEGIGIGASKASKALKGITNIGGKLLGSLASAGLSMAVSAAIGWIIGEIGKIHISAKEAEEALNSFTDSFKEFNSEITAGKKKLPELEKEYWNLADGVDSLGNNVSLTEEQYETYLQTVEDIHELMPSLSTYFNEQGQAIGFVKSEMKGLNDQYKQYEQNQIHERWFTEEDDGRTKAEKAVKGINNQSEEFSLLNGIDYDISKYQLMNKLLSKYNKESFLTYSKKLFEKDISNRTEEEQKIVDILTDHSPIFSASGDGTLLDKYAQDSTLAEDTLFNWLKDTVKSKKAQLDDNNVNIRNLMTAYAKDSDGYATMSGTESEDLVNFINSFDFASMFADYGDMTEEDYEGLAAQIIKGVKTEGFSEAFHNVLDDDKISTMSYKEAEKFVNKNLEVIRKAMGWEKDSDEYLNFKATLGFEADDEELFNQASEKTGIPIEKIKELFTKGEIELIANVDFKPSGSGKKGKYTEDEYDKAEADVEQYAEVKNAQTELDTADNKLKSSLKTIENYGVHYGKIVEMVNGTRFITDPKELNELLEALPELKDHLKYTESGWMLEAEAMDGVQKSVLSLQQAYVEAQQILSDSAVTGAMTRIGINESELTSMTSIADAYKLLAQKFKGGITFTASGELDTSTMTNDQQLAADGVLASLRLSQAQKVMQKTAKLSAESAKEDRKKQIKDLKDQQYLADLQHQFEEINQTLEEFTKQLEILKKAQDDLFESDYIGKLDYINQRYETQNNQVEETQKSLDELLAMQPETAQGWNELATTVENLSTKLFEGKRALIDYQVELSQTYMNGLKAIGEASKSALEDSNSQYDRNVKMLKEGGLGGLQFKLTPIAPKDAVEKQREENKKLAKEEEAYQEKVNQIKKRALDEMKAYEDAERARQLADLTSEPSETMASLNEDFWKAMNMGWSDFKELIETEGIDVNINWSGIGSSSKSDMKRLYADQHGIEIIENPERKKGDKGTGWKYKTADGKEFENIEQARAHTNELIISGNSKAGTRTQLGKDLGLTVGKAKDGTNEYYLKLKNGDTTTYDSLQDVQDSFKNLYNGSDPALKQLYCNYYGVVIDKTNPDDWKYIFAGQTKENIEDVIPLVNKRLSAVSTKAKGGTATGDIIVNEEGQESYLGKDGKLHLFKPGAQFFNTDEAIRVFNAEDTAKIRKYTGDKYFNEPIGDLSKVTQLASGNIHAIFPAISPENANNVLSNETTSEATKKATEEHYDRMGDIQNKALNEEISMDAEAQAITEVQKEQHYDKMEIAQQTTNDITSQEQIVDNAEKVTEEKRFSTETEGVVTELLNWMKNNPIKAPGLDTASWEQMISDAQGYMNQLMGGFGNIAYNPETGNKVLDMAASFNGRPYVYGGGHGNGFSGGLDCSGYVSAVLSALGYKVVSDANGFKNVGSKVPISEMQPGDILIFDYKHDGTADHVGFYAGNNQMWHSSGNERNTANNPGRGVHLSNLSSYYKNALVQVNRVPLYASGTHNYGVAGENYKKEFLIDKKTGQWTEVNYPTLIDTNEVDVVGEKASAKINKPLPMYADGTLTNQELLNIIKAVSEESGVPANVLAAVAQQETGGKWYDKVSDGTGYSYGYMMLYDNGVIADLKAQGRSETAEKAKVDPYTNVAVAAEYLKKFYEQGGDWKYAFGRYNGSGTNGDYARQVYERMNSSEYTQALQNIGTITTNTSQIRRSFDSQFRDFIDGSNGISNSESVEDSLMNFIKSNTEISSDSTEKFIEAFEGLNNYKDSKESYFEEKREKVRNAMGTPEFTALANAYNKEHSEYIETIMGYSTDMTVAQAKSQYKLSEDAIKAGYKYYNERKNAGASATELMEIATKLDEMEILAEEYSDAYVQAISAETDFLVSRTERTLNAFDNEMSWLDEDLEKAEGDTAKQTEIYGKKNDVSKRAMDAAQQRILNIRQDEDYADIFATYDVESWFDANGELTSKFYEDVEGASSELIPYMNQLAKVLGVCKKDWYENAEAIEDNNEAMADLKIEEYIKYQERLVEALDFDASISQSLSTAKEGMYSLFKTLRDEKAEMDKELKANMQIDDWLTEDTRRQLFNLDDYEEQMGVINEIEAEAQSLYAEYQNDLANLKEDELYKEEEITAEYNRQLESLQDKLSIAKADLQLAKDKAAFENALKERDTQIIMGNRVQNVADPERLREAAMKVAESESALENEKTTSAENQDIRNMEATTGMINQEKGAIQNRIDMINGMTEEERKVFADFLEPLQVYRNRILALTKTNPYRIITGDNSNDVFMSRDYSKIEGYSLTQDHSSAVDEIQHLLDNGYYKQGTPEYDVALKTIDFLKKQHDDKTTSDAHNYGYELYDPANSVNWYRYMKMYTDAGYAIQSQERPSIDGIMSQAYEDAANNLPVISGEGEILVSANKKPHSSTTFSGDGDISLADGENVGINEFNDYISQLEKEWEENTISITPYSGLFEDYKEVSLAEMISPLLDDSSMAESIAQNIVSGAIAPNIDTIASVFSRAQALDLIKNGNNDNSIHMQNVNVTLEKPVADPNDFIQQLISKVNSEYSTTNNQR